MSADDRSIRPPLKRMRSFLNIAAAAVLDAKGGVGRGEKSCTNCAREVLTLKNMNMRLQKRICGGFKHKISRELRARAPFHCLAVPLIVGNDSDANADRVVARLYLDQDKRKTGELCD